MAKLPRARFPEGRPQVGGRPSGRTKLPKPKTTAPPKPVMPKPARPRVQVDPNADLITALEAIYGPQRDFIQGIITKQQTDAAQQAAYQRDWYQKMAQWLQTNVIGGIQGVYSNAAQNQSAFGQGFSDAMKVANQASAGGINATLADIGAPQGQMINPDQATSARDVLYGVGGFIPANTLNAQGAAFQSAAEMQLPAYLANANAAVTSYLKSADKDLVDLQGQLVGLQTERAGKLFEATEARKAAAAKAKEDAWKKNLAIAKYKLDVWKANNPNAKIVGNSKSGWFSIDPKTGKATQIVSGFGEQNPTKTVGGYIYEKDPKTGKWVKVAGTGPTVTPGKMQQGPNGSVFDPNTGLYWRNGKPYLPPVKKGSAASKKLPVTTVRMAQEAILMGKQPYYAFEMDPTTKLTAAQISQLAASVHMPVSDFLANKNGALDKFGIITDVLLTPYDVFQKMLLAGVPEIRAARMTAKAFPAWAYAVYGKGYTAKSLGKVGQSSLRNLARQLGVNDAEYMLKPRLVKEILSAQQAFRAKAPKASAAPSGGRTGAAFNDPNVPPMVNTAINAAMTQLGQKYVWGGESRGEGGFDCSGLIDWAFRQAGVDFPGRLTTWSAMKMGNAVPLNQLLPGDFIISNRGKHMTLYIGGGKVIAASSARGKVVVMPLSELGAIVGARRVNFGGYA